MAVKAVLFDLDGTLYDRDALVARLFAEQFHAFRDALTVPSNTFVNRLLELDEHGYRDRREVYRIASTEWSVGSDLCAQLENDFWSRYDDHCVLDADTRTTLETLYARGVKMAVVTNGGADRQRRKVDALGIASWLEAVVISEVEGIRKPDPEILHRALTRCGASASAAMFVGDHPDVDVGGALRAGMHAVWKRVPYWSCSHDVPVVRKLSEILPML